jgi:hypothetical protein
LSIWDFWLVYLLLGALVVSALPILRPRKWETMERFYGGGPLAAGMCGVAILWPVVVSAWVIKWAVRK